MTAPRSSPSNSENSKAARFRCCLDAILVDIGNTLVHEAPPNTPTHALQARLLPNVLQDLEWFRETLPIAAVTNTSVMTESDVRRALKGTGLNRLLDFIITSADVGVAKPDPLPLLVAIDRLTTADTRRILYIGDLPTDAAAAEAAGMPFAPAQPGLRQTVTQWHDVVHRSGHASDDR